MGVHSAYQSEFHADDSYASEEEAINDPDDTEFDLDDGGKANFAGVGFEEEDDEDEEPGLVDHGDDFEDKAVSCFRFFVLFILVGGMIAAGVSSWKFLQNEEYEDFAHEFDLLAHSFIEETEANVERCLAESENVATTVTALGKAQEISWPFFTDDSFHAIGSNFRKFASARYLGLAPIVSGSQRDEWKNYTIENQGWIRDGLVWANEMEGTPLPDSVEEINGEIFTIVNGEVKTTDSSGPFAPIWQTSRAPPNPSYVVNFDALSNPTFARVFETVQTYDEPVLSERMDLEEFLFGEALAKETIPTSFLVYPLKADFGDTEIVGAMIAVFSWETFFTLEDHHENPVVVAVIRDGCGEEFTIHLTGNEATFVSNGDVHDTAFDEHEETFTFAPFLRTDSASGEGCEFVVSLYPSQEFYESYQSSKPAYIASTIVGVILFGAIIFCLYDCAVHTRQQRILAIAAQSERILSVLYPKSIRDRLFGTSDDPADSSDKLDPLSSSQDKKVRKKKKAKVNPNAAKHQLKSFINSDDTSKRSSGQDSGPVPGSKPIADLFPHATVLFADIAGFTAWSSVREPSQVFTLLETVYAAFDKIAKRRRVFKVETVGDCYVAVTGLPEPRKDHATLMCRFARDCLERFNELAGQLETVLGPDTGDLAVRVGLHSGPVTAGVLRGDKSRFQLFGDTVNTAARIESGGRRNKIHLSMETADLVKEAGKGHWLKRREHVIEAKGKGKLQTFWLLLKGEGTASDTGSATTASETDLSKDMIDSEEFQPATPIPKEIAKHIIPNLQEASVEEIQATLPSKVTRLVKWNVEVLSRLLKQVVAKRNAIGNRRNYDSMLNVSEAELRKKFFVLDEVVEIIPLPAFDQKIHKRQSVVSNVELSDAVVEQLNLYVSCMACYHKKENAFHNFEHASHVMMSVSKLLSRIVAADDTTDASASGTHDHTYGITSDPMTQFSVVLAALVHDVDHGGVSNMQLIKEGHKLATLFKGKSVAEQNSIVLAWDTLMEPRFYDLRRCIYTDPNEFQRFRQLITNTVLATDIFDQQLSALRKSRWEKAFQLPPEQPAADDKDRTKPEIDLSSAFNMRGGLEQSLAKFFVDEENKRKDTNRKATIVIEHLIQASDVAHTMQHWHIYRKWNERLFHEMTNAFKAGRMAKNPADFWYQGELGFYDNYIIPLAKKLKDCGVFGVSSDEYLNYALENRREWSNCGEEVVAEFIRKYQPEQDQDEDAASGTTVTDAGRSNGILGEEKKDEN